MNASKCVTVQSSWIAMAILMCDNTLSVLFKDGACCNYPGTTQAHFNAMLAAPSKGRWLWQNLYKILPYRRIRLPCPAAGCGTVPTGCCPNAIPNGLHATVTGGGVCNGSYALTYNGVNAWDYTGPVGTCARQSGFTMVCQGNNTWGFSFASGGGVYTPASLQCTPLVIVFSGVDLTNCGGTNSATVTVTL